MVYVSDLAEAFLSACTQPGAANQEMIVAGPEAVSLHDMLATLASLAKRRSCGPRLPLGPMLRLAAFVEDFCNRFKISPPLYRRRMDFYTNDAAFDSSHAQRVLGWKPRVTLREGLARTLRSHHQSTASTPLPGFGWLASMLPFVDDVLASLAQASMLAA
jgi:nucleoside-diphosphate-sugar epimerase